MQYFSCRHFLRIYKTSSNAGDFEIIGHLLTFQLGVQHTLFSRSLVYLHNVLVNQFAEIYLSFKQLYKHEKLYLWIQTCKQTINIKTSLYLVFITCVARSKGAKTLLMRAQILLF